MNVEKAGYDCATAYQINSLSAIRRSQPCESFPSEMLKSTMIKFSLLTVYIVWLKKMPREEKILII